MVDVVKFSRSHSMNAWRKSYPVSAVPNNFHNLIRNQKDDSREIAYLNYDYYSEPPDPVSG